LFLQAKLTLALAVVARLAAMILPASAASGLLIAAFLVPAWIAGFYAGAAAPRLRWWQLLCAGAVGTLTYGLLSALAGQGSWSPLLRCWLAVNLGLDFLLAGWIGRRWRLGPTQRTAALPALQADALPEAPEIRRAG
jgi:hypothetical protein